MTYISWKNRGKNVKFDKTFFSTFFSLYFSTVFQIIFASVVSSFSRFSLNPQREEEEFLNFKRRSYYEI
jgi:hypothetical protein